MSPFYIFRFNLLLFAMLRCSRGRNPKNTVTINVQLDKSLHYVDKLFVANSMPHKLLKWKSIRFGDEKFRNLCKNLAPTSVRVLFNPLFSHHSKNKRSKPKNDPKKECHTHDMTVKLWEQFYDFIQYVGWQLSIDFTNIHRTPTNEWNSANAKAFLDYAEKKKIPIPDFQLGNEPNLYESNFGMKTQTGTQTVKDFESYRNLLKRYPMYKDSTVVGPETTRPTSSHKYFNEFLANGGCNVVDEISFHQYYRNKDKNLPTYKDFLNVSIMELLVDQFTMAKKLMADNKCEKRMRLGETSSVSGGLPIVAESFVAGFLWLDKLGQSALHGITRVYRFNIWGGSYSLLDRVTFLPNPDYYLTLLYKKLVEGHVFNASSDSPYIRAYANCAKPQGYKVGALVIYMLNVKDEPVVINLPQFGSQAKDVYWFTSGAKDVLSQCFKSPLATSKLRYFVNYPEIQGNEILDYLFKMFLQS
ncbi:heparanase-like isoform X3 [Biomphalaria glabrata]|uniref:Heparanase-like isoform X3 n=1 Tax=Biomphalaria glabrata TaxID=6526 RepID=A0A9W2Z126_BIOGL|nr:heparanase-like isoform X3 [Biomphalaria glabrata]XP_055868646.1 heparanase-like isoform X3 [Biomphalaria glabrata]XP_055868647.1 heparanase-like isoform X3 [Biomphalaria glabrata]XP_055868648.1 heparanase-like isoform X3 [Biomphalaria glabrata]